MSAPWQPAESTACVFCPRTGCLFRVRRYLTDVVLALKARCPGCGRYGVDAYEEKRPA